MRKYTGYTYVKKLERCLRKMSYEERLDAVNYYSEYLADAGPEHEQEVIARLGPPQRVAAEIKADAALRELNAKAEVAENDKARRKAKKENGRAERTESPNMGESFSAAGLGAIGMLSMPVARPFAILACVVGIIGLIMSVTVVVALYAAAGAFAVSGLVATAVSVMIAPQDIFVTIFLAGFGIALIGAGLLTGALNYMLGRAIFKGIANLSGRIRHKRVKVRRDIFNYTYKGADRGYPYTDGGADTSNYTSQPGTGAGYPYTDEHATENYPHTEGRADDYTSQPGTGAAYPYTDGHAPENYPYTDNNTDTDNPARQPANASEPPAQGVRVEDRPKP
ncbi:MAG: DUF1700 domain-containing protein [Clostridiales Family XIII bacterium]|jgi:uncharacterized membrane protein|nr:DUF1700 domain-containing protein [Clostridiales Family XIII bacterium]